MPELSNDLLYSQKKFAAYQISNAKIINTGFHGRIWKFIFSTWDDFPWNGPDVHVRSAPIRLYFATLYSVSDCLGRLATTSERTSSLLKHLSDYWKITHLCQSQRALFCRWTLMVQNRYMEAWTNKLCQLYLVYNKNEKNGIQFKENQVKSTNVRVYASNHIKVRKIQRVETILYEH